MSGKNLEQVQRQKFALGSVFSELEVANIAHHLLLALKYVHEQGIVHGNISPSNVILAVDERATLVDFGAAKYTKTLSDEITEKSPPMERALIDKEYLESKDINQLGVLVF